MQITSVKPIHFKSTLQAATTCPACHYHPIEVEITGASDGSVIKTQVCERCASLGGDRLEMLLYNQRRPEKVAA